MAASGPTRMLDQIEYISVSAVTATMGSAFTAGHFWKRAPKVTKKALGYDSPTWVTNQFTHIGNSF
ncbi:hypothetical protein PspCFBP13528_27240 [Pseudomonas sp. CFBP13528]|nr:hypothetical protein PspCFBP13528_27240 [Pseudomonas sp. CFBP13528]